MSYFHFDTLVDTPTPDLTLGQRNILLVLCRYANKDHQAWPNIHTLMKATEIERSNLYKYIKVLATKKYITIIKQKHTWRGSSDRKYCLNVGVWPTMKEDDEVVTDPQTVGDRPTGVGLSVGETPTPYIKKDIKKNKDKEKYLPPVSGIEDLKPEQEDVPMGEDKKGAPKFKRKNPFVGKSAEEITSGDIKVEKRMPFSIGPNYLYSKWVEGIGVHYPGVFIKPPTTKTLGMLKHFMKAATEKYAVGTLEYCISDWTGFTMSCKEYGLLKSPDFPTINFLLIGAEPAVNFYLKKSKINKPKKKKLYGID